MYHITEHIQVHERGDWHARQPQGVMAQQRNPSQAFIHHGAESDREARSVTTQAQVFAAMREVQAFHMDTRGWSDIAYHYVVFQPHGDLKYAHICEGRLVHNVPAAQLNHNTGTFAVCVFGTIGKNDPLHDSTREALAALLGGAHADKTGAGGVRVVGGHRDVVQTDCPGDTLYAAITHIAHDAGIGRFKP